ncbi:MAG: CDP-diacylglycerol--glycerol-3-phosphate 3-phosphatidyltransferase [Ignavibacteria bacterium CG22_combo_CG10-13_8_21_14_all_37_15]|nr:MAG: CDP-diacylglycerol--glycerol-3-phosphate 3-phosphatidyltransferase [Ignavibacteria bacterium CG22_combo_CG10-13_8_21_14_all_37_15]PJC58765.1 MAG: CDP-diacylglycerol--glycerol-3-phosphate 3-phosphatidyltransferase [Ignavibacteria bacterium CG_4_9_14_0_2_um_filter_37_13]
MILPNQLTVLRIILSPIFLYLFLSGNELLQQISLGVYLVAAFSDWYDGWLARKYNFITAWGKFWDPLADKILNASAFIGFVYLGVLPFWMVFLILLRDFTITGFRGYTDYIGISFTTSRYAKVKTFFQMAFIYYMLVIYILSQNSFLSKLYGNIFDILLNETFILILMIIVTFITVHSGFLYFTENKTAMKKLLKRK